MAERKPLVFLDDGNVSELSSDDALINGITVGRGPVGHAWNTVIGAGAATTATGHSQVIIGYQAGASLTNQNSNVAIGAFALSDAITQGTVAVGHGAARYVTSSNNVAIGYGALGATTSGVSGAVVLGRGAAGGASFNSSSSVIIGFEAAPNAYQPCIGIGQRVFYNATANVSGSIAIGQLAAASLTGTSQHSVVVGYQAAQNRTSAHRCVFIGGFCAVDGTAGQRIVAIGYDAYRAGTGSDNVAVGQRALYALTSATRVTAVGQCAGDAADGGSDCTYVGSLAGVTNTPANANVSGANNTFLGASSGPASPTQVSGATALGYAATVGTSNTVVLGRTTDVVVAGATGDDSSGARLQVTGAVGTTTEYRVGGAKVVGARDTGWSPITGTAAKGGFAAYSAPTISDPPTAAEVQAIADALQAAHQTIKALTDALTAHGLIGA